MHRRFPVVALFAAIAVTACSTDVAVAPVKAPKAPSLAVGVSATAGSYILALNGNKSADALVARVAALGGTVTSYHTGAGLAFVSGLSATAAADLGSSGMGDVQADFQFAPDGPTPIVADASDIADVSIESQANPAGASRFPFQWNMRLIGAPAAWTAGKLGSSTVTVAILDTGIDYDAPDLNGLVDLSRSKSFMNHFVFGRQDDPTTPEDEYTPIIPSDDQIMTSFFPTRNKINDLNGHGTNVATQVSSKAAALAGVTSKTTLIGVKVLGANGYGSFSDILAGVLWAADNGADVANMSLGGGFSKSGSGGSVALINRAFNYAKQKGMLVVVSAGNSSIDLHHNGNTYSTFCDAPHVVCVSSVGPTLGMVTPTAPLATNDPDQPSFFTNFGKNSVDVAAPGGNADAAHGFTPSRWPWSAPAPLPFTGNDIASWVWSFCAKHRLIIQKNVDGVNGNLFLTACVAGNRLTGFIGTSQASPHVAGLAALLIAENGKGNPQQIKRLIQKSADPIDGAFGRGRISVKNALGL